MENFPKSIYQAICQVCGHIINYNPIDIKTNNIGWYLSQTAVDSVNCTNPICQTPNTHKEENRLNN
jgi:hypothetical protein